MVAAPTATDCRRALASQRTFGSFVAARAWSTADANLAGLDVYIYTLVLLRPLGHLSRSSAHVSTRAGMPPSILALSDLLEKDLLLCDDPLNCQCQVLVGTWGMGGVRDRLWATSPEAGHTCRQH